MVTTLFSAGKRETSFGEMVAHGDAGPSRSSR
jgi:hypothetical protein